MCSSDLVDFTARVVERKRYDQKPALILDQTCFYPESGGQPFDRGTINGVSVSGVFEEGEGILHVLDEEVVADKVEGKIDWETRFDHMQQHTGQHILSQSFFGLFGAETLSFHLGKEMSAVEIDLRKVSDTDVERVEEHANSVIFQNREVKTYFVPEGKINYFTISVHQKGE